MTKKIIISSFLSAVILVSTASAVENTETKVEKNKITV